MAKPQERFVCQACGAVTAKWAGRCDGCGAWNTIVEETLSSGPPGSMAAENTNTLSRRKAARGNVIDFASMAGSTQTTRRFLSGIEELDRVCGGGLVPGSVMLVGGDPGIGKSTLLMQACAALTSQGHETIYISGEEALEQLRLRARRLDLADSSVKLATETNMRDILATLDDASQTAPAVLVIDSIQTMWSDTLGAAPGTVTQVRACSQELIRFAKKRNCAVFIIGHVTKDGQIAGPRVVEHMVDTVLYFEGERSDRFRILRSVKNRFGPTNEIGVFDMCDSGLKEVRNPSALFLDNRGNNVSGAAVFAGIEGSRPVLVEIQALVAPSTLATPRRAVVGWDSARLSMVLAVLDARCGLGISAQDVYLNVAGGLRIREPAADLAVAAALISSMAETPLPQDCVVFGEISLSGAIRPVAQTNARLKEAAKLGFAQAILSASQSDLNCVLNVNQVDLLGDLVEQLWHDRSGANVKE